MARGSAAPAHDDGPRLRKHPRDQRQLHAFERVHVDEYAGVGRDAAARHILPVRRPQFGNLRVTTDFIELRNLVDLADLIVRSAMHRKESRGLHFTLDWPNTGLIAEDTVLVP